MLERFHPIGCGAGPVGARGHTAFHAADAGVIRLWIGRRRARLWDGRWLLRSGDRRNPRPGRHSWCGQGEFIKRRDPLRTNAAIVCLVVPACSGAGSTSSSGGSNGSDADHSGGSTGSQTGGSTGSGGVSGSGGGQGTGGVPPVPGTPGSGGTVGSGGVTNPG